MGTIIESQLVKNHTMLPGGARKEFRNELLFLLSAHSEHLKLLQCIEKFIGIHINVGKSVGKIIIN